MRRPLPTVTRTAPNVSPSYGTSHILDIHTDSETKQEQYIVVKTLGAYDNRKQYEIRVPPQTILKYVSIAELERFENELAQIRAEQEKADYRARLVEAISRDKARSESTSVPLTKIQKTSFRKKNTSHSDQSSSRSRSTPWSRSYLQHQPPENLTGLLDPIQQPQETSEASSSRTYRIATSSRSKGDATEEDEKQSELEDTVKESPDDITFTLGGQYKNLDALSNANLRQKKADSDHQDILVVQDSENEEIFEVEKIIGDKIVDGERVYVVKWVGDDETTEEPSANLEGAQDVVGDYWTMKARN